MSDVESVPDLSATPSLGRLVVLEMSQSKFEDTPVANFR